MAPFWVLILIPVGCSPPEADRLVIATHWPESVCRSLEKGRKVLWIRVRPGNHPIHVIEHGRRCDIVLGGPVASYRRAAANGGFLPLPLPGAPRWAVARRSPLGRAVRSGAEGTALAPWTDRALIDRLALPDPRRDPNHQGVAALRQSNDWRKTYANLVLESASARPFEPDPEEIFRSVSDHRALAAPAASDQLAKWPHLAYLPDPTALDALEGVAIVAGTVHLAEARAFIQSLPTFEPPPAFTHPAEVDSLLADLLSAATVESHEELRQARAIIAAENDPSSALRLLTEPPPWPPVSIARMRQRPDAEPLLATLAEHVAPDLEARQWLRESWDQAPRAIDMEHLDQLATAAGGKLVAEPRFRSWLRSEWIALSRQRYRRVALRASAGDMPP